jgi:hypothetical protein
MPTIVPFYAALLAALYIFLSVRVIRMRVSNRIGLGDGSNPRLRRAIRVHANFSEYVSVDLDGLCRDAAIRADVGPCSLSVAPHWPDYPQLRREPRKGRREAPRGRHGSYVRNDRGSGVAAFRCVFSWTLNTPSS